MLLAHPAVGPGVILVFALGTTRSLGIESDLLWVHIGTALHVLGMKHAVEDVSFRREAGGVEGDTDVGVCPGQPSVALFGTAVFACLVVLFTASTYR